MMTKTQLKKLLDVLNLSERHNILDVGCGTGALTEYLADHTDGMSTFSPKIIGIMSMPLCSSYTLAPPITLITNFDSNPF